MSQIRTAPGPFITYRDYLEYLLSEWPEYTWLYKFWKSPSPNTSMSLCILDYSNHGVSCLDFSASERYELESNP
jgi:hypothetical protein